MGITNVKWIGSSVKQDTYNRLVSDTEKNTWNGKANSGHTHTKANITDFPDSLKNPKNIVVRLNSGTTEGSTQFTYDGSTAKTINITPSKIGAAAGLHTHTLNSIKFNSSKTETLSSVMSLKYSAQNKPLLNLDVNTYANGTMYLNDGAVIDGIVTFNDRTDFNNYLHIYGANGSYSECIRTHAAPSGWNSIVMCGADNEVQIGTSDKTWGLFTYDGQFSIAKNGTNLNGNAATASLRCDANNNWYANDSLMITVANLGNYTIQNSITAQMLYCNPPDQNTNAGCFMWQATNNTDKMPDGAWWSLLRCQHPGYPNGFWQELAFSFYNHDVRYRVNNNGTKNAWRKLVFDCDGIIYRDPYDLEVKRLIFYQNRNVDSSGDLHATNGGYGLVISFQTTSMRDATISRITSTTTYSSQRSNPANLYIGTDGVFYRATSASKYKLNIQNMDKSDTYCYDLLKLNPKQWVDKNSTETYSKYLTKVYNDEEIDDSEKNVALNCDLNLNYGLIAEDLKEAGLGEFCEYGKEDEDGNRELEGIHYDRLPILMIPMLRDIILYLNKISSYVKENIKDEDVLNDLAKFEEKFEYVKNQKIVNLQYNQSTGAIQ